MPAQTLSGERPIKATDGEGRDVVRFDGNDDTLAVASPPSLASGMTLFIVFAVRTRSDFSGIVSAAARYRRRPCGVLQPAERKRGERPAAMAWPYSAGRILC